MKAFTKTIFAVIAMGAAALAVQAQTQPVVPKVLTIDMVRVLNNYYKTIEENARIQAYEQNAQKTADGMIADGRVMAEKFKAAQDTLNSPVATDSAKKTAQDDSTRLLQDIRDKEQQLQAFRQQAVTSIQNNVATIRQQLIKDISDKATAIGRQDGATMIVDKGALVFADNAMDITNQVIDQLNAGHPRPVSTGTGSPVSYPSN